MIKQFLSVEDVKLMVKRKFDIDTEMMRIEIVKELPDVSFKIYILPREIYNRKGELERVVYEEWMFERHKLGELESLQDYIRFEDVSAGEHFWYQCDSYIKLKEYKNKAVMLENGEVCDFTPDTFVEREMEF